MSVIVLAKQSLNFEKVVCAWDAEHLRHGDKIGAVTGSKKPTNAHDLEFLIESSFCALGARVDREGTEGYTRVLAGLSMVSSAMLCTQDSWLERQRQAVMMKKKCFFVQISFVEILRL